MTRIQAERKRHKLKFRRLTGQYAIVRLDSRSAVPAWAMQGHFVSISRTEDELSIVCPVEQLPADVNSPLRWICLKLEGPFPFSQTGVLLSFIEPVSDSGVPIFAVATYDTDYVLIPDEFSEKAIDTLERAGHELARG